LKSVKNTLVFFRYNHQGEKMKLKTLLALCFLSFAIDQFGGVDLLESFCKLLNPASSFNWGYTIAMNGLRLVAAFWKFGFPVFFGKLFPKTRRSTWWVAILVICGFTASILQDLVWWHAYPNLVWWTEVSEWVFGSINSAITFAWVFYGGLVLQQLTKGVDFTKFDTLESWTGIKNWYADLTK